eukprot:6677221-Pyramimonas_sp.AAC.1
MGLLLREGDCFVLCYGMWFWERERVVICCSARDLWPRERDGDVVCKGFCDLGNASASGFSSD